ncbi:hypothetical protein D3C87_2148290 [compost metagenome]
MKNLLAIVGVIVVAKKGYEFFREYMEMKQELENVTRIGPEHVRPRQSRLLFLRPTGVFS